MSILHQLMSDRDQAIEDCLSMVSPGDEILLVGDAVGVLKDVPERLADVAGQLIALAADAREHEVESLAVELAIGLAEDVTWVEKITHHEQVLSWL